MAKHKGQIIHEGPMADRRGTDWRDDAAKLEALDDERIQNPMKTPPNNLTSIDKAHAHGAKGDEGRFNKTSLQLEGEDAIGGEE